MRYKEARQLVLDNMEVVLSRQRKPDTFVEIRATVFGQSYEDWDTAKYNLADEKKEGVKFSASFGLRLATGRAVKRIARRVMRIQAVQIDVTVTGAQIEEREDGRSYVVAARALARQEGENEGEIPLAHFQDSEIPMLQRMGNGDLLNYDVLQSKCWFDTGGEDGSSRFHSAQDFRYLVANEFIGYVPPDTGHEYNMIRYTITETGRDALAKESRVGKSHFVAIPEFAKGDGP